MLEEKMSDVLHSLGFEMKSRRIPYRPDNLMSDMPKNSSHWDITLTYFKDADDEVGKSMQIYYSMGPAHKDPPKILDVLYCIASDSSSVHHETDCKSWANGLGYDLDINSRRIYNECVKQKNQFIRLIGQKNFDRIDQSEWDI